ncbi:Uncharacterised protein [uncultured archaeon]|nr:Uncharacterised protein [uncultured archaeon]
MVDYKEEGVIADLHLHSRFSRACSKDITLDKMEKYGRMKGLDLLGTSDFTHPVWLDELKQNLKEERGILTSKTGFRFILSGEISLMYTQGRGRRIHLVLLAPSFEVVDKINSYLDTKGRRDYDGRPIFKISCEEFTREMFSISPEIEVIPAHVWTPYFGVFGSKSGFDSLKEAFGEQIKNIHAIETGMSSDPEMNWAISELNTKSIISFSDSHSFWPWRMGREATIFKKLDSYSELIRQIRENDFIGTVETDPSYGIYHFSGHKDHGFSASPEETQKLKGICPICGKMMTIGVANRVVDLTSQKIENYPNRKPFFKLLPLHELIALDLGSPLASNKTWEVYNRFIEKFENEFNVLLHISKEELSKEGFNDRLVELIILNRDGKLYVKPGYDGAYGVLELPSNLKTTSDFEAEKKKLERKNNLIQKKLTS